MKILAVDPGKATGFAYWITPEPGADETFYAAILQGGTIGAIEALVPWLEHVKPDLVVCEDFYISANTAKKSQDGKVSIEIIGCLRWLCFRMGIEFETQPPSDAMSFVKNDKLRRLGWWTPGKEDHARSATKHLVLALAKRNLIDAARLVTHEDV